MQQFRDGVAEWAAFANLHFIEYIGAPPTNFITVQESNTIGEGGFSSSVGMAGGEQFVQFSPTAWNRGTVCHEVGHALGLYHEQQRDDRDTYVIINFGNIDPSEQPNFTKIRAAPWRRARTISIRSCITRATRLSNNGMDTISMQPGFTQFINIIGAVFDRTLSKLDRAGMAAVYGNPSPAPSAVVTNTNDSGPGSLRAAIYYAFDQSPTCRRSPPPSPFRSQTAIRDLPGCLYDQTDQPDGRAGHRNHHRWVETRPLSPATPIRRVRRSFSTAPKLPCKVSLRPALSAPQR